MLSLGCLSIKFIPTITHGHLITSMVTLAIIMNSFNNSSLMFAPFCMQMNLRLKNNPKSIICFLNSDTENS